MNSTLKITAIAFLLLGLLGCSGKTTEQLIADATQHLAENDFAAATIELKNALKQDAKSAEARWLLGQLYLTSGDAASAEKELQHALTLGWDTNDVLPALAHSLVNQGKFEAVNEISHLDLEPQAAALVLSSKALAEMAGGDPDRAQELVLVALLRDPDSLKAKLVESRILASRGDPIGALIVIEEILSDAPTDGDAWSLKADILLSQRNFEEARAAYDKSIALLHNNFGDRLKRALLYLQLQEFDSAQKDVDILLDVSPQHPASNFVAGLLHYRHQRYAEAITALSVAEPAAKQFPLVLYYLASAHLAAGHQSQAAAFASDFNRLAPGHIPGRQLLALIRLQQGNLSEVRDLIQPILDRDPDNVGSLNLMANALLRQGDTDGGIALLAHIAELQPGSAAAQIRLGAGLLLGGDGKSAVKHIESALELDPEFQQADILLVMNHVRSGDLNAAITAAKDYRARNPDRVTPHNLLGRVYLANKQFELAAASFQRALRLDAGDPAANHHLAQQAFAEKDLQTARQHYDLILQHHPDFLAALLQLASLDSHEGKHPSMVQKLQRAIEIHPEALQPRLILSRYYLSQGKAALIPPLFATIDELQKQAPAVLQLQALAQLAGKQHGAAQETLRQLGKSAPKTAAHHHLLAVAAAGSGNLELAEEELLRALALDKNFLPALLAQTRMSLAKKHAEDFRRYLTRLAELAPDRPEVLQLRAVNANISGDPAAAVVLAKRAFAASPSSLSALQLARFHAAAGEPTMAADVLREWVEEQPLEVRPRLALAELQQADSQLDEAISQYEAVLTADPDNIIALNNLAWHQRQDQPEKAMKYAQRALQLDPNHPAVLDTMAILEHRQGNQRRAMRNIQRALKVSPGQPSMLYHRAMIELALDDREAARTTLQQVLTTELPFPEQDDASALLSKLEPQGEN